MSTSRRPPSRAAGTAVPTPTSLGTGTGADG